MVATNSCPKIIGDIPAGIITGPSKYSSKSVPQIPVRSILTNAIPGGATGVGISSTRKSFALYQSAARIYATDSLRIIRSDFNNSGFSKTPCPGSLVTEILPSLIGGIPVVKSLYQVFK